MKKTIILLVLFLSMISLSCDKEYKFFGFDIEETINLEFDAGINENIQDHELELYFNKLIDEYNSSSEKVEEITIESVIINTDDPYNINSLTMMIGAEGENQAILANTDSVDIGSSYLKLAVSDEPMDKYIKKSTITINTIGTLYNAPEEKLNLPVKLRFRVLTYVK